MLSAGLDIFEYNMSEKSSDAATGDLRPEGDVSDQNGRDGMPSLQQEASSTSTLDFFFTLARPLPKPQFSFYCETPRTIFFYIYTMGLGQVFAGSSNQEKVRWNNA